MNNIEEKYILKRNVDVLSLLLKMENIFEAEEILDLKNQHFLLLQDLELKKIENKKIRLEENIYIYPSIPKKFEIQKKMLRIRNRNDEIKIIDDIIKVDRIFSLYMFKGLYDSFENSNNDFYKLINVMKCHREIPTYNALNSRIKYGYNSSYFKHFLMKYFNTLKDKKNVSFIIISSPILYSSLFFLCKLSDKLLGINSLWEKINSFLFFS